VEILGCVERGASHGGSWIGLRDGVDVALVIIAMRCRGGITAIGVLRVNE